MLCGHTPPCMLVAGWVQHTDTDAPHHRPLAAGLRRRPGVHQGPRGRPRLSAAESCSLHLSGRAVGRQGGAAARWAGRAQVRNVNVLMAGGFHARRHTAYCHLHGGVVMVVLVVQGLQQVGGRRGGGRGWGDRQAAVLWVCAVHGAICPHALLAAALPSPLPLGGALSHTSPPPPATHTDTPPPRPPTRPTPQTYRAPFLQLTCHIPRPHMGTLGNLPFVRSWSFTLHALHSDHWAAVARGPSSAIVDVDGVGGWVSGWWVAVSPRECRGAVPCAGRPCAHRAA